MLTDSYGQGVPYPTLLDKPNAQSLGQGIVENLVPRSVLTYPSAAVRGASISAPREGMVSYLADVDRLEFYTGSAWQSLMPPPSARGTESVGFLNATSHTRTVSFGMSFDEVPFVSTNIASGTGDAAGWVSRAISVNTTGFTLFLFSGRGTKNTWSLVPVQWRATL